MFALRSFSMQWRYGLAPVAKPTVRIGAAVGVDPKPDLPVDLSKPPEEPKEVAAPFVEQPLVVEPLVEQPLVEQPLVEQPNVIPLAEIKVRKKLNPKSYAHLLTVSVKRGKATDKAILDVLFSWEKNSTARWGAITNIRDSLTARGITLSVDTIRDHVTALAKAGKLCLERQILDPQRTYVKGKSNIVKYLYVYLVALNGDNGERGMVDFVIRHFCDSYIERDEKGRFLGLY